MRTWFAALALTTGLSACSGAPISNPPAGMPAAGDPALLPGPLTELSTRPFPSAVSPSPLMQVQAGAIQALVPDSWQAEPLPETRYPQQGFVASPRIAEWDEGSGMVRGMEIYWIDITKVRIPSDFYYLVARGPAMGSLAASKHCQAAKMEVLVDHPPRLDDRAFSPGDYVASGEGTCRSQGKRTRWAYVVAAPGYGPAREVGIPTSGLYVVVAVVSGSRSEALLKEIIGGARFGNATINQIVDRAIRAR